MQMVRHVCFVLLVALVGSAASAQTLGYVYVNAEGSVVGYAVDSAGNLTAVPGSPFTTVTSDSDCDVMSAVYDSTRQALYVSNPNANSISGFTVDLTDGSLTPIPGSPFALTTSTGDSPPAGLAIDATHSYLYAGKGYDIGNSGIEGFSIAANGALTLLAGSPYVPAGGESGFVVGNDPVENTIITGSNDTDLSVLAVGPGGALTQIAGSPYLGVVGNSHSLAFHPTRRELAVGDADGYVVGFHINAGGGLSAPTDSAAGPEAGVVFTPDGTMLYGVDWNSDIYGFTVATGPNFTAAPWTSVPAGLVDPVSVAMNDTGTLLFVNGYGNLHSFTLGVSGQPIAADAVTFTAGDCGAGIVYVSATAPAVVPAVPTVSPLSLLLLGIALGLAALFVLRVR